MEKAVVLDEQPIRTRHLVGMLMILAIALCALDIHWPLDDFEEYWTAGKLNLAGMNPYDPSSMLDAQRALGSQESEPVMMYNPPWVLALSMPMSMLNFQIARSIWLPCELFLILWAVGHVWRLYTGSTRFTSRMWLMTLLWSPVIVALRLGQTSPLMLAGLCGFIVSLRRNRDFAAGAFFSLTAVKPQLMAMVWLSFALWTLWNRRWALLSGVLACLSIATLAAVIANPQVLVQYSAFISSTPPQLKFESPNIGTLLRIVFRTTRSWPQYIPTALGAIATTAWYLNNRAFNWQRQLPVFVLLSCWLTSYGGWECDLVILLVPIIAVVAELTSCDDPRVRMAIGLCAAVSFTAFIMHSLQAPQASFIWMTPSVTLIWWLFRDRDIAMRRGIAVATARTAGRFARRNSLISHSRA